MRLIVAHDAEEAARKAADELARACATAVAERGRACMALSGGDSPRRTFELLAAARLPWESIVIAQVDERCVPAGDPRRNLAALQASFVEGGRLPRRNLLAMPVEGEDLDAAAQEYARELTARVGPGLEFDVLQLGLGDDGHTASLVPGDPVLAVADRDVAITREYQGTRRMTLTFRVLDAARERLWFIIGASKRGVLDELLEGTGETPAVRVSRASSVVVADREATGK